MLFWLFEGRLINIERYDGQIDMKLPIANYLIAKVDKTAHKAVFPSYYVSFSASCDAKDRVSE